MLKIRQYVTMQVILYLLAVIWLIPMVNAFRASLDTRGWANYQMVLNFQLNGELYMPKMFINSVIVVGVSMILILVMTLLAAYAFSKMDFFGKTFLYLCVLGFFAIPVITILQPVSTIIRFLGLRDTYVAMILPMVTVNIPIALLIFRNYMDGISNSFMEAAMIDGCSKLNILLKIIVPMSTPAIINVLIVLFQLTWNEYAIPLMFNSKQDLFTLTLAPGFFSNSLNGSDIGPLYACIIIISIPTLIFYLSLQKKIIQGISAGGVKG